ncbi:MAG: hypothetical protein AB7V32_01810, partial [Candidatus Berkiella sp.]
EKLQWIKAYEGEYTNPYLKDAKITQTQEGFEITCKEWKSRLGAQCDQHGARYLVLLSPPFPGLLKLQAMASGDLVLDAGQEQYTFKKKDQLTNAFSASILHAKKQFDNAQKIQPKDEKDKAYEESARNRYH